MEYIRLAEVDALWVDVVLAGSTELDDGKLAAT